MKYLFLSLFSFSAFAFPTVGDYVQFASYDGYTKEAEITGFDQEKNQFQTKYTTKFNGTLIDETFRVENADDMLNSEKIEMFLANCEFFNGHHEELNLAVGNFDTCKVTDMDTHESFNVAHVPFGVVAMDFIMDAEPDPTFKKFTLQKFHYGPFGPDGN